MKVLLSAFACLPYVGSEEEVGLKTLIAAASEHEVWLLTRTENLDQLRAFLDDSPDLRAVQFVPVEAGRFSRWCDRWLGIVGHQIYYENWQRRAHLRAVDLDLEVGFDVAHHSSYAAYWAITGVSNIGKPLVWGPVGGGVEAPLNLLGVLGWRGVLREIGRLVYRNLAARRPSVRQTIGSAAAILSQNPETARRLRRASQVTIFPNAVAAMPVPEIDAPASPAYCMFVGRLLPYKAGVLAVEALHRSRHSGLRLVIAGTGPDEGRIRARIKKLGLEDRVDLLGRRPRMEVLALLAGAKVLIHPALHEDSSLAVGEALGSGTPVVCLDWGGPPVSCAAWPPAMHRAVAVRGSWRVVAQRLADGIDDFAERELRFPPTSPVRTFREGVLDAYRSAASSSTGAT